MGLHQSTNRTTCCTGFCALRSWEPLVDALAFATQSHSLSTRIELLERQRRLFEDGKQVVRFSGGPFLHTDRLQGTSRTSGSLVGSQGAVKYLEVLSAGVSFTCERKSSDRWIALWTRGVQPIPTTCYQAWKAQGKAKSLEEGPSGPRATRRGTNAAGKYPLEEEID